MALREFIGVDAEQDFGGPGTKLGANRADWLRNVADVKTGAGSSDDGGADDTALTIAEVVKETQGIIGQPEDEVHPAGRNNMFAAQRIG